jgi:hypothetical protein
MASAAVAKETAASGTKPRDSCASTGGTGGGTMGTGGAGGTTVKDAGQYPKCDTKVGTGAACSANAAACMQKADGGLVCVCDNRTLKWDCE